MDIATLRQVFHGQDDDGPTVTTEAKEYAKRLVVRRRQERNRRAKIVDPAVSTSEQEARNVPQVHLPCAFPLTLKYRTTHNLRACPLFTIPAELRNRIYRHALGGRNVHIYWHNFTNEDGCLAFGTTPYRDPRFCESSGSSALAQQELLALAAFPEEAQPFKGLACHVCQVPESDDVTYESSKAEMVGDEGTNLVPVKPYLERHKHCLQTTPTTFELDSQSSDARETLPVALLRTCRSIHREAWPIPLSENILSFEKPGILDAFLRLALTTNQTKALHSIHVYAHDPGFCLGAYGFGTYGFSLQERYQETASLLAGIKRLRLTLGKCIAKSLTRVLQFGKSLEHVEVVIGPQVNDHRLSDGQNRTMAEAIEKAVMYQAHEDPRGSVQETANATLARGPHSTAVGLESESGDES